MVRLIGFCLLAAVMTMLLRQMNPGVAALLCVAFGAMTLLMLLPAVGEYAAQIRDFLSELSLDAVYGQTMLKAMGIVLMTQFAAQVCRDMDAPSIACRAELCGRLMLLGVALPIFLKLTQMAVGALQGDGLRRFVGLRCCFRRPPRRRKRRSGSRWGLKA